MGRGSVASNPPSPILAPVHAVPLPAAARRWLVIAPAYLLARLVHVRLPFLSIVVVVVMVVVAGRRR